MGVEETVMRNSVTAMEAGISKSCKVAEKLAEEARDLAKVSGP